MRWIIALLAVAWAGTVLAEIGEDGLHKTDWMALTFRDVAEDLETAKDEGKRLALIFEQRGCIYCRKLHEEVFSQDDVADYIADNFMVVQYNLYGDEEVVDLDGETLTEKEAARKWGVVFTPTIFFLSDDPAAGADVKDATVQTLPGAFGKGTTLDMFRFIRERVYETDEPFQRYHARMIAGRGDGGGD